MEFRALEAEQVQPLRTRVLRPYHPEGEVKVFGGDDADSTHHFGLCEEGEPVAVVTFLREAAPDDLGAPATRLRGMAVAAGSRRRGLGRRLLRASLTRMATLQPDLEVVWCHARTDAAPFYESEGFERHGEVFDIDRIGSHVVMWRAMPKAMAD